MEIFWTVVAGVAVFVGGQLVVKFFIEPWHEYRMLVGRIAHALILYRTANDVPGLVSPAPIDEARRELRSLAGELWQRTHAIPFYGPLSRVCWWIPTHAEIRAASAGLIGMSNSLGGSLERAFSSSGYVAQVRQGLHLHDPEAAVTVHRSLRDRLSDRFRRRAL